MRRRSVAAFAIVTTGSVAVGLILGSLVRTAIRKPDGPRVHLESPASMRVVAQDKTTAVVASYRLVNDGDRNLVLGQTTTTCGCTLASIEPTVVPPHGSATVKVLGEPPEAGERDVHITVETNDQRSPHLNLELIMVGATPMPFIGHTSGPIQFGTIERNEAEADFFFDTHERQGVPAWSLDVRTPLPGLSIKPGKIEVVATSGDALIRRRNYHATYHTDQPSNGLLGDIEFIDPTVPASPVHKIQVLGIVHTPVYAIPRAIYGSYDGLTPPPTIQVSIHSSPGFSLQVAPEDNPAYSCQLSESSSSRLDFIVTFRPERLTSILTTSVVFSTNHPKLQALRIPAVIQRVAKQ
jgi:hypothetical protein